MHGMPAIVFAFGAEQEFYLFKLDEAGKPTKIPYDEAGYMDIAPEDKGENIRREICLTAGTDGNSSGKLSPRRRTRAERNRLPLFRPSNRSR